MTRESVIEAYMINKKRVIAEMLYDTINNYEDRKCENCKYFSCDLRDYMVDGLVENFGEDIESIEKEASKFGCNQYEPKARIEEDNKLEKKIDVK